MNIAFWKKKKPLWIYGTCNGRHARKHRIKGNVQFVLWKAGEQGHKEDYWHDFGAGWAEKFVPYPVSDAGIKRKNERTN